MDGVAHLRADQGLVAEVVVAGDERIPLFALRRAPEHGAHADGARLIERFRRRFEWRAGVGSEGDRRGAVVPPIRRQPAIGRAGADPFPKPAVHMDAVQRQRPEQRRQPADALITAGKDLLDQKETFAVPILTTAAFLSRLLHPAGAPLPEHEIEAVRPNRGAKLMTRMRGCDADQYRDQ